MGDEPVADEGHIDVDARVASFYAGPPASFVAERDALVRALRTAGRRDEATQIKALRKPRTPAWALDAGAHARPDALADLVAAVDGVAAAQADGDDVRAALGRVRDAEAAVVEAAADAAARLDQRVAADDLAGALRAVIGDTEALQALAAGRLVAVPSGGGPGLAAATGAGSAAAVGSRRRSRRSATGRADAGGGARGPHDATPPSKAPPSGPAPGLPSTAGSPRSGRVSGDDTLDGARTDPGPLGGVPGRTATAAARKRLANAEARTERAAAAVVRAEHRATTADARAQAAADEARTAQHRAAAAADNARRARRAVEDARAARAAADDDLAAARAALDPPPPDDLTPDGGEDRPTDRA